MGYLPLGSLILYFALLLSIALYCTLMLSLTLLGGKEICNQLPSDTLIELGAVQLTEWVLMLNLRALCAFTSTLSFPLHMTLFSSEMICTLRLPLKGELLLLIKLPPIILDMLHWRSSTLNPFRFKETANALLENTKNPKVTKQVDKLLIFIWK